MPVAVQDINQEILYILQNWIQNNNRSITGTIGQNVVWNLAQFIKKNPENWNKATVVSSNSNYTTSPQQCIIIFNNNSSGKLNWVDNIWNKYYFVNATDNERLFSNGKVYFDINGVAQTSIAARKSLYIAKGEDDYWYEISSGGGSSPSTPAEALRLIVGEDGAPVEGESTWQHPTLINLGGSNNRLSFAIDTIPMISYGASKNFDFNSAGGFVDISPNIWVGGSGIEVPLLKNSTN